MDTEHLSTETIILWFLTPWVTNELQNNYLTISK